jgi:hypothetical protein
MVLADWLEENNYLARSDFIRCQLAVREYYSKPSRKHLKSEIRKLNQASVHITELLEKDYLLPFRDDFDVSKILSNPSDAYANSWFIGHGKEQIKLSFNNILLLITCNIECYLLKLFSSLPITFVSILNRSPFVLYTNITGGADIPNDLVYRWATFAINDENSRCIIPEHYFRKMSKTNFKDYYKREEALSDLSKAIINVNREEAGLPELGELV